MTKRKEDVLGGLTSRLLSHPPLTRAFIFLDFRFYLFIFCRENFRLLSAAVFSNSPPLHPHPHPCPSPRTPPAPARRLLSLARSVAELDSWRMNSCTQRLARTLPSHVWFPTQHLARPTCLREPRNKTSRRLARNVKTQEASLTLAATCPSFHSLRLQGRERTLPMSHCHSLYFQQLVLMTRCLAVVLTPNSNKKYLLAN